MGDPADFDGRIVTVVLGRAFLPLLGGAGEGLLSVAGYAPRRVSWTAPTEDGPGSCEPDRVRLEPGGTSVTGTVTHEETGEPAVRAWVEGCGGLGFTDEEGIYSMEVVTGPCQVMAMRQDGMLRTMSPPVDLDPEQGRDTVVDLQIPGYPRAGLGIAIKEHDRGFEVLQVVEGSGSATAGLQEGDLVLEIDGRPATDLDLGAFVEAAGGREGTGVDLLVERDGEETLLHVERRQLL